MVAGLSGRGAAGADSHGARATTTTCGLRRRESSKRRRSSGSRARISSPPSPPASTCSASDRASRSDFPSTNIGAIEVQGSAAWELDFWGKFRRATEAARAQLLASEWGRRAVLTTLVSQVSERVLRPAGAGSGAGHLAPHARVAAGVAAADAGARAGRRHLARRRPAGRTAGLRRDRRNRHARTARSNSRRTSSACCSAPIPDRSRAAAR